MLRVSILLHLHVRGKDGRKVPLKKEAGYRM